jgi:ATP-dependent Clp protease adaptor protein ClpS
MSIHNSKTENDISVKTHTTITEPPMYRVLLHNDNYTTMEFVVEVLVTIFKKSPESATQIMLNVHRSGVGICGTYSYELAETKVDSVHLLAEGHGFPLKCSMERE